MRKRSVLLLLAPILVLTACAATNATSPIVVTQSSTGASPTGSMPRSYPYPAPGEPILHPSPLAGTPSPVYSPYPVPGTPFTTPAGILPSGYEPQAGDDQMRRDPINLDLVTSRLVVTDTQPVQVVAILNGDLPNPKHVLRVVVSPDQSRNLITLEMYSLVPPGILSSQVQTPFSAEIPLGSYSSGIYTVMVNGEELGKFLADYAPQVADTKLSRGEVNLDSSSIQLITSGTTVKEVAVNLSGNLPDPCHQLRIIVTSPDNQNRIDIQVYSVFDPQTMCIMVIKSFEVSLPLNNLASGHYSVYVNEQLLGEFDR